MLKKFMGHLNNVEEYFLVILFPAMVITIFVSTFARFTGLFIIPWAEEAARYMMIWLTFFGIGAAAKRGEHFCVTAFTNLLPMLGQKVLIVVRMVLMTGFTLFIARFCIVIMQSQIRMGQITPSLRIPMWTMYSAIVIGCTLMLIRYVVFGIQELRNGSKTAAVVQEKE